MRTFLFAFVLAAAGSAFVNRQAALSPVEESSDPSSDTLTAQVAEWGKLKVKKEGGIESRKVLSGSTHDLSMLHIVAVTLEAAQSFRMSSLSTDLLVIVREGSLTVSIGDKSKVLGPGGVALLAAGEEQPGFKNGGTIPVTYYAFHFKSRKPEDPERGRQAGSPFFIDWKEMVMKKTDKGESRQIFDRPVAWLGKIDMHATTLNAGEVSHPPHIHRAEEIILMRSGNVQMYIGGQYHKASAGDLVYLSSGVPHALENKSHERCEYFALQWLP
ncbi:MAG TPA: cupin domain-containing protein [Puia sp.]|jgi:(S)-ureidoglycine aminohydrolase